MKSIRGYDFTEECNQHDVGYETSLTKRLQKSVAQKDFSIAIFSSIVHFSPTPYFYSN